MSQDISDRDVYLETNRLAVLATSAIEDAMSRIGFRRSELAARLNVPKSRVTKVLDGESNVTLKTLASFGLACNVRWSFVGTDVNDGSVIVHLPEALASTTDRSIIMTEVDKWLVDVDVRQCAPSAEMRAEPGEASVDACLGQVQPATVAPTSDFQLAA